MKKAQMEIIGLVIVVFIISIALIFVIKYVATKKPAEFKKEFTQATYANNIINTLLQTTSKCLDIEFVDLFDDCGKSRPDGSVFNCEDGPKKSCTILKDEIKDIMDKTLGKLNVEYYFVVVVPSESPPEVIEIGTECTSEKTVRRYPLPTTNPMHIKLEICEE